MESPLDEAGKPDAGTLRARPAPPSRRAWILAGAAAAVVFLIFDTASAFIAVPLRELSSILAQAFLQAIGFAVTRHGTILTTSKATFDVVPACSGSSTLQVLLFLSIVWCGVHPGLTPVRRGVAILLAIPLAILANALRVSGLVAAGHALGAPPEGILHSLAGLVAFALAMIGCFALTQRLASASKGPDVHERTLSWIFGALLVFLSLPFLGWCLEHWGGAALDRFGYFFLAAAGAAALWKWKKAPADRTWERAGTACLGLAFLGLTAGTLVDVNILKGFSLLLAFLGFSLANKGIRFAASMIPVAIVAYLGFPSVSYQLGVLTSWRFTSLTAFMGIKTVVGLLLLTATLAPWNRPAAAPPPASARRYLPVQLLMAALLAAFQTYFYGFAGTGLVETQMEMSYLQGPWIGVDDEPPGGEKDFFGNNRIWSRRFTRDKDIVDILVTSTGGDRHRAHPPAYCVTGAGWEPMVTDVVERRLGDGTAVPMTRLQLRRGDREMVFCYWFTNGSESHATFSGMMIRDTLRRLGGRRTDWLVFRVMTSCGQRVLDEFLSDFKARIGSPTAETVRP